MFNFIVFIDNGEYFGSKQNLVIIAGLDGPPRAAEPHEAALSQVWQKFCYICFQTGLETSVSWVKVVCATLNSTNLRTFSLCALQRIVQLFSLPCASG